VPWQQLQHPISYHKFQSQWADRGKIQQTEKRRPQPVGPTRCCASSDWFL
jgi:hypothetical protein